MIQYACDTCSAIKEPEEVWIVGLAAEAVGAMAARREISVESVWSRETAVHPLAVHFCSTQCKDEYVTRLFAPERMPVEKIPTKGRIPATDGVERTIPAEGRLPMKKKFVSKAGSRHKRVA